MAYLLFADDDPVHVRAAVDHATRKGHRVKVLRDGRQVVDSLRVEAPDLLITDVIMPWADAFQYLLALREHHPRGSTGVILLDALGATGEPSIYETDEIDYYIIKPFNPWQLIAAIEHVLYRRASVLP